MNNLAFVLIVAGILLAYGEFIWVGKLVFGVLGAIVALIGVTMLSHAPHNNVGLAWIGGALLCFGAEARWQARRIAGISGTLLFGFGFWKLSGISPLLAAGGSVIFGTVTTGLLAIAKRARHNKRLNEV